MGPQLDGPQKSDRTTPVDVSQTPLFAGSKVAPNRDDARWADLPISTSPPVMKPAGVVRSLDCAPVVILRGSPKAVGDRSAGGLEAASGSLRRGTYYAVNEPSPTGRIRGTNCVTA